MTLISVRNLTKNFGIKPLLNNLSFVVEQGERVGVIGANGSGKSTLLRLMANLEEPDDGDIIRKRGLTFAYVPQAEDFSPYDTIEDYLNLSKHVGSDHNDLVQARMLVESAGIVDTSEQVSHLSGGWLKRLSLLRGLISNPDLLVLDEPTNHLDIPGILWLEQVVTNSSRGLICVTHDRYFLERIATRVIELDARYPNGMLQVEGSYSDLIEKRADVMHALSEKRATLANKVRREVEWLRQGAKARTTKSKHRTDAAHQLIDELNAIDLRNQEVDLEFSSTNRKTKDLVKLDEVYKGFGDKALIRDLSFTIRSGTRVGIVGANGAGKTTLLKLIVGELKADKGTIVRASNLQHAFFGQHREQLKPDSTISEVLAPDSDSVVFQDRSIHIASWVRRFSFRADQLKQPISSLSGGEQARLLLAKLMLEPADLLIFDEPTNDLDIPTLEVLEQSFVTFPGAIVVVSHDRYMVDRVCTRLIGLLGDAGTHVYSDYLQFESAFEEAASKQSNTAKKSKQQTGKNSYETQKEVESLERKISRAENDIQRCKEKLHDPSIAHDISKLQEIQSKIEKLQSELDTLISLWDSASRLL